MDAPKAVLRGKFISMQSYPKKARKTFNIQPKFTAKTPEKRTKQNPKLVEGKKS